MRPVGKGLMSTHVRLKTHSDRDGEREREREREKEKERERETEHDRDKEDIHILPNIWRDEGQTPLMGTIVIARSCFAS
jgi:hypothetical protein